MRFGIAISTIIPLRNEPAEQSEMVSQVLFGELFTIIEKKKTWFFIQLAHDNYEGWIDEKMFKEVEQEAFEKMSTAKPVFTNKLLTKVECIKTKEITQLVPGSLLHFYDENTNIFKNNNVEYKLIDAYNKSNDVRKHIVDLSKIYLNAPYLWGGRTPFGIDCSGFTQILYKLNGIDLPRDAKEQVNLGTTLNFIHEAKPGDLAFFENTDGIITHTGVVLVNELIIHASGKVRIDKLDHQGIYNSETKKYSHKLRVIQNIID